MKLDQGIYRFEVKDGQPEQDGSYVGGEAAYIYCNPTTSQLSIAGNGRLSIHLQPGAPYEEVAALAKLLNGKGVSFRFNK